MNKQERAAFAATGIQDVNRLMTTYVGRETIAEGTVITFGPTEFYIQNNQFISSSIFADSFNGFEFWQIAVCFGDWNEDECVFVSSNNYWRRSASYDAQNIAHFPTVDENRLKGLPLTIMQELTQTGAPTNYKCVRIETFENRNSQMVRIYHWERVTA